MRRRSYILRHHQIVVGEDGIAARSCDETALFLGVAQEDDFVQRKPAGIPGEIAAHPGDDSRPLHGPGLHRQEGDAARRQAPAERCQRIERPRPANRDIEHQRVAAEHMQRHVDAAIDIGQRPACRQEEGDALAQCPPELAFGAVDAPRRQQQQALKRRSSRTDQLFERLLFVLIHAAYPRHGDHRVWLAPEATNGFTRRRGSTSRRRGRSSPAFRAAGIKPRTHIC
ncbi:hypothetical protein X753_18980 [Mesorhizobium sp. LNJC399B00]|nr:hypothetical protein X753_18980 [Mesorhizobium sp. LNJC399B00]